jgi:hypothetical protein
MTTDRYKESLLGRILFNLKTKRNRCRQMDIPINISEDFISCLLSKQQGRCFYSDAELSTDPSSRDKIPSLDRIIPTLGYTEDNVVICSKRMNTIKSNLSLVEIKRMMPPIYKKLIEHLRTVNPTEKTLLAWRDLGILDDLQVGTGEEF